MKTEDIDTRIAARVHMLPDQRRQSAQVSCGELASRARASRYRQERKKGKRCKPPTTS